MEEDLTIEDTAFTPRAPEKSRTGGTNYVRFGRIECSVDLGVIAGGGVVGTAESNSTLGDDGRRPGRITS